MTSIPITQKIQLSKVLRHSALKEGLVMDNEGFILLDEILKLKYFKDLDLNKIQHIVRTDNKNRLELKLVDDKFYLRANQGHSIKGIINDELLLESITIENLPTVCIHGTYLDIYDKITTDGLCKMGRNHIHCCEGIPLEVKSGARPDSNLYIYIDIIKALNAGILFFRSRNGVILTPGDENGYLKPKFFLKVEKII
jgi:2'-phosphotransferase